MSYHDIKLRPSDKLFSQYIRGCAKWKCEKCGRKCKVDGQTLYRLEASHYYSRRSEATRFDPDNVHALCFTCHQRMGGHTREEKSEYDEWMKEKLGKKGFILLKVRNNTYKKRDDKMDLITIKQLIKDYEKNSIT